MTQGEYKWENDQPARTNKTKHPVSFPTALAVQCHDLSGHVTGCARFAVRNGVLNGLSLTALAGSAGVLLAVRDGGNGTFVMITPGCRGSDAAYVER
ncbi:hypothetical protein DIPPA_06743 [Diplonema papillatum]|nr:hypothetical protein DIPPA_06743 [Diplonema papillatum]